MYLKFVKVDCHVPRIVASLTFSINVSFVSVASITTSVRLQNSFGRRRISPQGFVPPTRLESLRPNLSICLRTESIL